MTYPIESLKLTSSEEEAKAAFEATIQQLVSEGKSPEEAQATATEMIQSIMAPQQQQQSNSNGMSIPVQQPTDYGINVRTQRAKLARNTTSQNNPRNEQEFTEVYNAPRGKWNSPWNPSPQSPSSIVNK